MQTDEVLRLLTEVAAAVITPRFRALEDAEISEKRPGDLVTAADHEAERLITRELNRAYPDAVVLGEEAFATDPQLATRYRQAEHAFTVDPVDGTKNFVNGSADHAVMCAELRAGVVVRAWIWQPQHQLGYVAEQGAGCWRNSERLRCQVPGTDPGQWRGATSRRSWVGRQLRPLAPLSLTWVCCGVDYPRLIEGAADFLVYRTARPWDHAPGSLLVTEAGGYCGTMSGESYHPRTDPPGLIVAADRHTWAAVQSIVGPLAKEDRWT